MTAPNFVVEDDGYAVVAGGVRVGHVMRSWGRVLGSGWRATGVDGKTVDFRTRDAAARWLARREQA
jgi:hypothetical protein